MDEWNRAGIEFRRYRDKDGDGFIDKHELKVKTIWIYHYLDITPDYHVLE